MAKTRRITLTKNNWNQIDEILSYYPDSKFLRFCIINIIVEEGIKKMKESQRKHLNE